MNDDPQNPTDATLTLRSQEHECWPLPSGTEQGPQMPNHSPINSSQQHKRGTDSRQLPAATGCTTGTSAQPIAKPTYKSNWMTNPEIENDFPWVSFKYYFRNSHLHGDKGSEGDCAGVIANKLISTHDTQIKNKNVLSNFLFYWKVSWEFKAKAEKNLNIHYLR